MLDDLPDTVPPDARSADAATEIAGCGVDVQRPAPAVGPADRMWPFRMFDVGEVGVPRPDPDKTSDRTASVEATHACRHHAGWADSVADGRGIQLVGRSEAGVEAVDAAPSVADGDASPPSGPGANRSSGPGTRIPPGAGDPTFATVPFTLPHHRLCATRRPPRWVRHAPRRDAGGLPRPIREGWRDPRIRTAPDAGPMRINMTYNNACMTSADFSPTIGRDVFTEGAAEGLYRSILTTDHDTAEFAFQIATITWTTATGDVRSYTLDGGRITAGGDERWFEVKAHPTYLLDPETKATLAAARDALASHDIGLDEVCGSTLLEPVRLREVGEVLRHRNVPFDSADAERALEAIARGGGVAPLALVEEAIGGTRRRAHAVACSMLVRRTLGFPVDRPIDGDTPVRAFVRPDRRLSRFGDE